MKRIISYLFFVCCCCHSVGLSAQSLATEKGVDLISGTVDLSSLALNNINQPSRTFFFDIQPTYQKFVADRLAVGGTLTLNGASNSGFSQTAIGLGPRVSYFFDSGGQWIPYLNTAVLGNRSQTNSDLTGVNDASNFVTATVSGGVALRINQLAVLFDLGYIWSGDNGIGFTTNRLSLSVGLVGFLYQGEDED